MRWFFLPTFESKRYQGTTPSSASPKSRDYANIRNDHTWGRLDIGYIKECKTMVEHKAVVFSPTARSLIMKVWKKICFPFIFLIFSSHQKSLLFIPDSRCNLLKYNRISIIRKSIIRIHHYSKKNGYLYYFIDSVIQQHFE